MPSLMTLRSTRRRTGSVCSAAFVELFEQLVAAQRLADGFGGRGEPNSMDRWCRVGLGGQQCLGRLVRREQGVEAGTQRLVLAAFTIQPRHPPGGRFCQGELEQEFFAV
jgi:hypothetical protein